MTYQYVKHAANKEGEGIEQVADVYVIQNLPLGQAPSVSSDFRMAIERLSPAVRSVVEGIITKGFTALIR